METFQWGNGMIPQNLMMLTMTISNVNEKEREIYYEQKRWVLTKNRKKMNCLEVILLWINTQWIDMDTK